MEKLRDCLECCSLGWTFAGYIKMDKTSLRIKKGSYSPNKLHKYFLVSDNLTSGQAGCRFF